MCMASGKGVCSQGGALTLRALQKIQKDNEVECNYIELLESPTLFFFPCRSLFILLILTTEDS